MAEVKWQARRTSDSVLVDVTADISGTAMSAPTENVLEAGSATQVIYSRTTTLTDAQIKTLPAAPVDIVPAPGAGMIIVPLEAGIVTLTGSVAYTNVHADAALAYQLASGHGMAKWSVFSLLTFGADAIMPLNRANESAVSTTVGPDSPGTFTNRALQISGVNASGNWTGGDAANTLEITVLYTIVNA